MFLTFITFTLIFTVNGEPRTMQDEFAAPIQIYGSACSRGAREYRQELAQIPGASLWLFECVEGVIKVE